MSSAPYLERREGWGLASSGGIFLVGLTGARNTCSGPSMSPGLPHRVVAEFPDGTSQGNKADVCGMFMTLALQALLHRCPVPAGQVHHRGSCLGSRREDVCPIIQVECQCDFLRWVFDMRNTVAVIFGKISSGVIQSFWWIVRVQSKYIKVHTNAYQPQGKMKHTSFILCTLMLPTVQFRRLVMSNSLRPHEPQHTRPPCPSPTPGVYSNS